MKEKVEEFLKKEVCNKWDFRFSNLEFVSDPTGGIGNAIITENGWIIRIDKENLTTYTNQNGLELSESLIAVSIHEAFHRIFPELNQASIFMIEDENVKNQKYFESEKITWEKVQEQFPQFKLICQTFIKDCDKILTKIVKKDSQNIKDTKSLNNKNFLSIIFFLLIISATYTFASATYVMLFSNINSDILLTNFTSLVGFSLTFIFVFILNPALILIAIIKLNKINNSFNLWIILSLILIVFTLSFGFKFMSETITMPINFPTSIYTYEQNSLSTSFNLVNSYSHDYAVQGDNICYNMTTANNNSFDINMYSETTIWTPTDKGIPQKSIYLGSVSASEIKQNIICRHFNETGFNRFNLNIIVEKIENGRSVSNYTYYNTEFIFNVFESTEYFDLLNQRYLNLILVLASIPIVLSSIKTIRDLYEK